MRLMNSVCPTLSRFESFINAVSVYDFVRTVARCDLRTVSNIPSMSATVTAWKTSKLSRSSSQLCKRWSPYSPMHHTATCMRAIWTRGNSSRRSRKSLCVAKLCSSGDSVTWETVIHAILSSQWLPAIESMAINVSTCHLDDGANLTIIWLIVRSINAQSYRRSTTLETCISWPRTCTRKEALTLHWCDSRDHRGEPYVLALQLPSNWASRGRAPWHYLN